MAKIGLERLGIDVFNLQWNRVLDINDRALRNVIVGLGGRDEGRPRETGFDISVASELMAILALVDGADFASALRNLRERVGRVVFGTSKEGKPLTLEDLGVAGAVTVLMKDTLHPNIMQTLEGQPAFVHAGPFANIAHGNSSILADRIALHSSDYVVTESGFGADMGMEKFMDIKCRTSGLRPDCVVLVATVRALKTHGGGPRVVLGRPLDKAYTEENLSLLQAGIPNLIAHINTVKRFGLPVVVAINSFPTDTWAEINAIKEAALEAGAAAAVEARSLGQRRRGRTRPGRSGGRRQREAERVLVSISAQHGDPPEDRDHRPRCLRRRWGRVLAAGQQPDRRRSRRPVSAICRSAWPRPTYRSSHDPNLKGAPTGFIVPVREVRASVGAGFIYPLLGEMRTMPGLGSTPAYLRSTSTRTGTSSASSRSVGELVAR